jgi:hypothetical protein
MSDVLMKQLNRTALAMSRSLNWIYEDCKECVFMFVGVKDDAQLYNLTLNDIDTSNKMLKKLQ